MWSIARRTFRRVVGLDDLIPWWMYPWLALALFLGFATGGGESFADATLERFSRWWNPRWEEEDELRDGVNQLKEGLAKPPQA